MYRVTTVLYDGVGFTAAVGGRHLRAMSAAARPHPLVVLEIPAHNPASRAELNVGLDVHSMSKVPN